MAMPHMQTEETTLNDEAIIFLCVETFEIKKVSRLPPWARNCMACRTEGFSTADLGFDNFGASLMGLLAI